MIAELFGSLAWPNPSNAYPMTDCWADPVVANPLASSMTNVFIERFPRSLGVDHATSRYLRNREQRAASRRGCLAADDRRLCKPECACVAHKQRDFFRVDRVRLVGRGPSAHGWREPLRWIDVRAEDRADLRLREQGTRIGSGAAGIRSPSRVPPTSAADIPKVSGVAAEPVSLARPMAVLGFSGSCSLMASADNVDTGQGAERQSESFDARTPGTRPQSARSSSTPNARFPDLRRSPGGNGYFEWFLGLPASNVGPPAIQQSESDRPVATLSDC